MNKTDAETISQDHVYATGRDVTRLLELICNLEKRIECLENPIEVGTIKTEPELGDTRIGEGGQKETFVKIVAPEKTYRELAKELSIKTFGKTKEVVLKEIAEKENGNPSMVGLDTNLTKVLLEKEKRDGKDEQETTKGSGLSEDV